MKILDLISKLKRKHSVSNDIENIVVVKSNTNMPEMTKEEYRHRKQVIDNWISERIKTCKIAADAKTNEDNEIVRIKNIYCPKCEHTDATVNKFVKKGVNVFKYNHCNHCGHEWEYTEESKYNNDSDIYTCFVMIPHMLDHIVCGLWNICYDPTDITCEFDSAEEMERHKINSLKERYKEALETFPLEIMYHLAYKKAATYILNTEEIFNKPFHDCTAFNSELEKYTGKFTEKMEDILVNKLGVKKMF